VRVLKSVAMHREILGAHLRKLRLEHNLSLVQLSRATDISSSFLSLVETGGSDITIGRLLRLADFYEVELSDLLTGGHSEPASHVHILRADAANILHSEQEGVDAYDLSSGTRWGLVPMIGVYQPGGTVEVEQAHEHEGLLFVLDGSFELAFTGEQPVRIKRGEGAIYRTATSFRVTNVSRARGRLLAVRLHPE
jgi:transcriptional regulator with XRE-family HTH domain